jgi:uncharacterized cupin superfamily protein
MPHWHAREDEFVYVLEGEVVLCTDDGERVLTAGMCAGFPAGDPNKHQLVNRSSAPARYLEMSNRDGGDDVEYADDVDLTVRGGKMQRRDGSAI